MHNDKEGQGLKQYDGKGEGERYVLFPFIAPPPPPQKESNRLTDLGKGQGVLPTLYVY